MKTVISTLALALVLTASTAALAQDFAQNFEGSAMQQMMENTNQNVAPYSKGFDRIFSNMNS